MDRNWEKYPPRNAPEKVALFYKKMFADPIFFPIIEYIDKNKKPYYWYHRKYNRVPTIDQCWDHDSICRYEADVQLKRDKRVDEQIIIILRQRFEDCMLYEGYEREKCRALLTPLEEAETNYFIKYGEVGFGDIAYTVFMKQKHRLAWERRHGKVGTGMKDKHYRKDGTCKNGNFRGNPSAVHQLSGCIMDCNTSTVIDKYAPNFSH
ncbi:hypothetical protein PGB90_010646 [Kerria lacca]